MVKFIRQDLDFILQQILYAEQNAAGTPLTELLPNAEVPWGLRTITGVGNNLVPGQSQFGAADQPFPRLTTPMFRNEADDTFTFDPDGPGPAPPVTITNNNYGIAGNVVDADPRLISNLIVDQTANNPAALAAMGGVTNNSQTPVVGSMVASPGLDGIFGTADDTQVAFIPNVKPDFNFTVPFNSWMTFFGQFFDHGLDLVQKSATETVFIPLQPDDPLFSTAPGALNFMVLSRAVPNALNTTSPFVDQNQTYSSHPSHQVFLREYALDASGHPVATGRLLTNHNLGADGKFGTADDTDLGGMATWATVKAQARDMLGIQLTDADVGSVPLLRTDEYGHFVRGPNGFPLLITGIGADGIPNTADDAVIEGNPLANGGLGISLSTAVRTAHQFLNDIAHNADPHSSSGALLTPDADAIVNIGTNPAAGQYDNELLDAHYIAGDGRVNENIGLTAVHDIFHSEHNRLVQHTKDTVIADAQSQLAAGATQAAAIAFLNNWLLTPVDHVPANAAEIAALNWNGERLFQAAKFGTEMQYQHLVFEEFARTVQPNIDEFLAPNGYDVTINPAIFAEFAHTVYRFGHSMLTETVDRFDPNFNPITNDPLRGDADGQQIGLIAAFLNPLAYAASGVDSAAATGAIVRGVTRQVGNEIDEFVTEALRNNLVGLPLDLAALNLARGRDTGIPSLNEARKEFFAATGDGQLKPYTSWVDYMNQLKHPESLVNFIAAYGTHSSITSQTTLAGKRAAALDIVLGGAGAPADRLDFLNSTGAWTNSAGADGVLGTADDKVNTGLDAVDFWIGGLAERQMPFGGLLGSTFNFVFETQLENLQNADRFYYLSRTAGLNFGVELEQNSFAQLVMLNTDARHLPADIFQTPKFILEADPLHQFNTGLGSADPIGGITINGGPGSVGAIEITPLVIRDDPRTAADESLTHTYLHYVGAETVVLGGTAGNDTLIAGSSDDDTVYGDEGDDWIDGGFGDDNLFGGAGDDIIVDMQGNDIIKAGAGNDVIMDGHSLALLNNLILGGDGKDFIVTSDDISIIFGGAGDDFILGNKVNLPEQGDEGDDWIELGTQDGAPGDKMNPFLLDDVPGNDIFVGGGGFDEMIGEGGDDIFVGSDAQDKMDGMSGFDWVTYKNDRQGVSADLILAALNEPPVAASPASILDRFAEVDGISGSRFGDILRGEETDAGTRAGVTARSQALAGTGINLISGMQVELDKFFSAELTVGGPALRTGVLAAGGHITSFDAGNIMLGGSGSDLIEGRGGDDLIDGDQWLNVRISVRQNVDGTGPEIASFNSMQDMIPFMLNRTYNPGQLVAVRELIDDGAGARDLGTHFDTANYRGALSEYTIAVNGVVQTAAEITGFLNGTRSINAEDVVTVTDTSVKPRDGVDHLIHVERLQFGDTALTLRQGLDAAPVGAATITDLNGGVLQTGDLLQGSIAGVTDADGIPLDVNGNPIVRFTWQSEKVPGSGVFEDIVLLPAGDLAFESASGKFFRLPPIVDGLRVRLKATYEDNHGVTEQVFSAPTAAVTPLAVPPPATPVVAPDATAGGAGVNLVRSDLDFIFKQIQIAEAHANGTPLTDLIPNVRLAYGLRAVDGSENNLLLDAKQHINQTEFGAADNIFPRLLPPVFNAAEGGTSYLQTSGLVIDSQPRVISNLVVDQTVNNHAAYAAAVNAGANGTLDYDILTNPNSDDVLKDFASIIKSPGLDGIFGTTDDKDVFKIDNVKPDFGLTAPYNSWFTFFGQFFDHGLDLVTKGGSGTVFVPLQPDDPLFVPGSPTNFMVLTRATNLPGPDGILGNADDIHEQQNTTTPFVDQNQTYTSHPSHQVFLREYTLDATGAPVATGRLITNRDLGADGKFGTADDVIKGGMATWAVVKAQARDFLGIDLTDANVFNAPLLATDQYGNFIKGPNGMPQVVMKGIDGIAGTADDFLVEGNRLTPISLANAVGTGHQFLIDIAHNADPSAGPGLVRFSDGNPLNGPTPAGTYDGDLLDAHYIAGDGRVNENIGLTAIHNIFHSEHNRLTEQAKDTIFAQNDVAYINKWLLAGAGNQIDQAQLTAINNIADPVLKAAAIDALHWNGERLFQVAKFGTEMQYQHLVFEEFARTIQPMVDPFFAPTQVYDVDLDASIVAEFAHTVYRFGHSMLTETVDRFDANFNIISADPLHPQQDTSGHQIGLIAAFLNPLAFEASGINPEEATGAIVRGVTRDVGNELDEFVTEALRNNLVGLPLDLATLNLSRGRDTGIPSLNAARKDFYAQTGDTWVKPYESWADLVQHLKHPESLINFIAAYGSHSSILSETTLAGKRAAAALIVLGGSGAPADRLDFLNSTGAYANTASTIALPGPDHIRGTADDITVPTFNNVTGVDKIDFWIGGLAEAQTPFGGLLGSTFNFVFENQLEKLQDGDRFYYLERTSGLSFGNELESNSFAKLIMANTNATHLPGLVFMTPAYTLEADPAKQFTGLGLDGKADPTDGAIMVNGSVITPAVLRVDPHPDLDPTHAHYDTYLEYTPHGLDAATVVLGGTAGNDKLIAGDSDDDTLWGDEGNDYLDGGYGNDQLRGGAGDDIIVDKGGDDNIQGGDGNDVIQGGNGLNLILGGFGKDFIITGEDASEAFGGQGNDFILGSKANEQDIGNEGDDWLEKGTSDGAPGDNFDPLGNDPIIGNDVFIGDGENDKFIGEGGDDIMSGKTGLGDRYFGGSGYDWVIFKDDPHGVNVDLSDPRFFTTSPVPGGTQPLIRFDIDEGLSGSNKGDVLKGDELLTYVNAGAQGSVLTQIGLINGLQSLLNTAFGAEITAAGGTGEVSTHVFASLGNITSFDGGNIILGGGGSDIITGANGNDVIDGDKWLNVRISVRANLDGTGPEIATFDTMTNKTLQANMLSGKWNPGQLQIVREILSSPTPDVDTAMYRGNIADYTFARNGVAVTAAQLGLVGFVGANDVITVADSRTGKTADGVDHLTHIERLQFADGVIVMRGANSLPVGSLSILNSVTGLPETAPAVGELLRVSIAGVTDADNVTAGNPTGSIPDPVTYVWQVDRGTGFQDITFFAAGELGFAKGKTFQVTSDLVGLPLRVRAVYEDGHHVLEQIQSAATGIVTANLAAPVITSLGGGAAGAVSVAEGGTAVTTVTATDADVGATLTFSITGGADAAKFAINATTGALSFASAPNFEAPTDAGANNVYDVTVQVSDGLFTDTQAIAVTVTNVNEPPVITSGGGGATAAVSVAENSTAVTTVTATDPDAGTTLSYSIVGGVDAAKFAINATTGALSFVAAPNFEVPTDVGNNNVYNVTVQVSDGSLTDTQAIAVTVTNVNEAPVITSNGGGATATLSVAENGTAVTTVTATDPDAGATLTFSLAGGADASLFTINAATGALSFKSAPNFEAPTDVGGNNVYDVIVQASDGTLTDTQALAITVTNVNEAPVITSNGGGATAAVSIAENSTAVTTVAATDPDAGTTLTFSITGGADAGLFAINSATGALSFKSAPNFEAPTDAGANNVYDVIVQASDGTLVDTQALAVTITNVNEAPVITSNGGGASATLSMGENATAVTTVTATDPDAGAALTFSISGGVDASLFAIDSKTGALSFLTAPNFEAPTDAGKDGTYDVVVQVSDGSLIDTQALAVTITNVNEAPVITSNGGGATATQSIPENSTIVTTVTATDPDAGTTFKFGIAGGADAKLFTIDASTGVLSFIAAPDFEAPADAGLNNVYDVTVSVSDGTLTDTQAIAVSVTDVGGILVNGTAAGEPIIGSLENDTLNGLGGNDTITGLPHDDILDGGLGADSMAGGLGNDTYFVDDIGDQVIENANEGTDTIIADLPTFSLAGLPNVENLVFTGTGSYSGTGNDLANAISGDLGNDTLAGGLGNDTLTGGGGLDTASFAGETSDMFINLAAGNARRGSAGAAVEDILAGFENAMGGSGSDGITGDGGANRLEGRGGADTIDGGAGNDTIAGGAAADQLIGGLGSDTFLYTVGEGADAMDGGAGADQLTISGTAGVDNLSVVFNGSGLSQVAGGGITGIEAVTANLLGPNDLLSYVGSTANLVVNLGTGSAAGFTSIAGIERVTGGSGDDRLTGNATANVLTGGAGDDTLTGGGGPDTLVGGTGSDTYIARNGDTISEAAGAGIDIVFTDSNVFTLDGNLETLRFTGIGNFQGTGNGIANTITGGTGADVLSGLGGNDSLLGGLGADTLIGGSGNDIMNGGAGSDIFRLTGGFGNDRVNGFDANAAGGQDRIDISLMGITSGNFANNVTIIDVGGDTLVNIGANSIRLLGVSGNGANSIDITDFVLA